ncbi:MAG: hypothetical protein V4724_26725 [Pseudomonadota bacterium]
MGRIRTVKPELFKHEDLFDLEQQTGLPIRTAFMGLFTCCDKEGRFKWRPRALKLDILPYDDLDFSRVLDALMTRGFVVKYTADDEFYGFIPTFSKHQVINNRESESELPEPDESLYISMTSTRAARVDDVTITPLKHAQVEGKGKEGKGREEEKEGKESLVAFATEADEKKRPEPKKGKPSHDDFERAFAAFPKRLGGNPKPDALKSWNARIAEGVSADDMIAGTQRYAEYNRVAGKIGTEFVMQAVRFFGKSKHYAESWAAAPPPPAARVSRSTAAMGANALEFDDPFAPRAAA